MEASVEGPTADEEEMRYQAYRVEVRALIVDTSPWSDFAIVYPTSSPRQPTPGLDGQAASMNAPRILTAPLYGYQAANSQGSHEFSYVICGDTIPRSVIDAAGGSQPQVIADIKAAVAKWEETVKWNSGVVNIITTRALPDDTPCVASLVEEQENNQIMFASNQTFRVARCLDLMQIGCWRSKTWNLKRISNSFDQGNGLPLMQPSSVYLKDSFGASWYVIQDTGCSVLHTSVVHEVGHTFGIGWPGSSVDNHSRRLLSVMRSGPNVQYCAPQVYDIVAMMANYQSR